MDHASGQSTPLNTPIANPSGDTVDSVIDRATDRFIEEIDHPSDPNRNQLFQQPQQQAPQEAETAQPDEATEETQAPEAEEATPDDGFSEVDIGGKQYRLPKEIADLATEGHKRGLREADYTRKTQEVAESRKHQERITQAATQLYQQAQQFAPQFAQVHAVDQELQQLARQLTPELEREDPLAHIRLATRLNTLMVGRQQLVGQLQEATNYFQTQVNQHRLQALVAEAPRLAKEIPGFENPDTRRALGKWGVDNYGLTDQDMESINWSPGLFRMLNAARTLSTQKTERDAKAKDIKAKVQTLPPVKPTGRSQETPEGRDQKTRDAWRKDGGKLSSPHLDSLLDAKLTKLGF